MTGSSPFSPFAGVFARGSVADIVSPSGWLHHMLDVEVALAKAAAAVGLASEQEAQAVAQAAVLDDDLVMALRGADALTGNPVPALVKLLRQRVPENAQRAVHPGATSQDVIDTAMVLMLRRASEAILKDIRAACVATAALAQSHRHDVMLGRTLLQPAVPITFGLKAANWLLALEESSESIEAARARRPFLQCGGAAGTLASLGGQAQVFVAQVARELALQVPPMPWHTRRLALHEPAASLAGLCGAAGKIAQDIVLLSQAEVAEVSVGLPEGGGGSSTMPHKQNPVAAIGVLGCTTRVPGLLCTLLSCATQEHERAAGAWHAEWETLSDILRLTGSAAAWLRELLSDLQIFPETMRRNYDGTLNLPLAEQLRTQLEPLVGRRNADLLVAEVIETARKERVLLSHALQLEPVGSQLRALGVDMEALGSALSPESYLGQTQTFIDNALAVHRLRVQRSEGRAGS